MFTLKLLQQFITVAEEEHVSRAAEKLHMSQSPLSQQIKQLEEHLGVTLFEREKQRIYLSDAGKLFLTEARHLMLQAQQLEHFGVNLQQKQYQSLTLAYVEGAAHAALFTKAVKYMQQYHPEVQLTWQIQRSSAQWEALLQHEIDYGFVYTLPPPSQQHILWEKICTEKLLLAVPTKHPLAKKSHITPADLDQQPWIYRPQASVPEGKHHFLNMCAEYGFTPLLCAKANDPATSLSLVAAGIGITLVQESMQHLFCTPEITFHPLTWLTEMVPVYAVWEKNNKNPLIPLWHKRIVAV